VRPITAFVTGDTDEIDELIEDADKLAEALAEPVGDGASVRPQLRSSLAALSAHGSRPSSICPPCPPALRSSAPQAPSGAGGTVATSRPDPTFQLPQRGLLRVPRSSPVTAGDSGSAGEQLSAVPTAAGGTTRTGTTETGGPESSTASPRVTVLYVQ
jgi:hypothetical protein